MPGLSEPLLMMLRLDKSVNAFESNRICLLEINWNDSMSTRPELPVYHLASVSKDNPVDNEIVITN